MDSTKGVVTEFVSKNKWEKSKVIILQISVELSKGGELDHKELEKDRGFLVYISRTYRSMVPYLKGVHQTLDSWRLDRNTSGWRLSREELREFYASMDYEVGGDTESPSKVQVVPRLKGELFVLGNLMTWDEPYRAPVLVRSSGWVGYGMVWVTPLEMGLGLHFISMVPCFSNMGSGLVISLRHPQIT